MVQEVQRRLLDQQIVVVGRAAQKGRQAGHPVGDFEAKSGGEKLLGGLLVQRSHHDVTEPARPHPVRALDSGRSAVGTVRPAWPVGGLLLCRGLSDARGDFDRHEQGGVGISHPQLVIGSGELRIEGGEVGRDAVEIVAVIGTNADLKEPPPRGRRDGQLIAAVDGGERASQPVRRALRGCQSKFLVVSGDRLNVGHSQRD